MIKLAQIVKSELALSYEQGMDLALKVIAEFENDSKEKKIEIDFEGIRFILTVFWNPFIGKILTEYGEDILKKIIIKNINEEALKIVKISTQAALKKFQEAKYNGK